MHRIVEGARVAAIRHKQDAVDAYPAKIVDQCDRVIQIVVVRFGDNFLICSCGGLFDRTPHHLIVSRRAAGNDQSNGRRAGVMKLRGQPKQNEGSDKKEPLPGGARTEQMGKAHGNPEFNGIDHRTPVRRPKFAAIGYGGGNSSRNVAFRAAALIAC
nr:hypothetical protein [Methylocapsa sp. S129]